MTRLSLATSAAVLSLVLAGCGGAGKEVATDPGTGSATAEPTSAAPTVGTYPPFEPADYTYTLVVACFCVGGGTPIDVTVRDGDVVDAVYDGAGRGAEAGTPADEFMWLTINDVIDEANNTDAASVRVVWPSGQDHPDTVYVDENANMVDEERGYEISQVVAAR